MAQVWRLGDSLEELAFFHVAVPVIDQTHYQVLWKAPLPTDPAPKYQINGPIPRPHINSAPALSVGSTRALSNIK